MICRVIRISASGDAICESADRLQGALIIGQIIHFTYVNVDNWALLADYIWFDVLLKTQFCLYFGYASVDSV